LGQFRERDRHPLLLPPSSFFSSKQKARENTTLRPKLPPFCPPVTLFPHMTTSMAQKRQKASGTIRKRGYNEARRGKP